MQHDATVKPRPWRHGGQSSCDAGAVDLHVGLLRLRSISLYMAYTVPSVRFHCRLHMSVIHALQQVPNKFVFADSTYAMHMCLAPVSIVFSRDSYFDGVSSFVLVCRMIKKFLHPEQECQECRCCEEAHA